MDNVTHTLAGFVLAEAAWQARLAGTPAAEVPAAGDRTGAAPSALAPTAAWRPVAAVAAVVAANLPDVDVPYAVLARLDPLASLLQHRGYTHTLLAAAVGAVVTWAAALGVWRRRARHAGGPGAAPDTAADRGWLFGLVAVAVLSHLALDWTNDYGVHPFSPSDNAWHYGDAVFIVEPWLWAAAVPALLLAARRPAARVALGLVLAAGLALAWGLPLVPRAAALALTAGAAASLALAARLRPAARAAAGVGGWLAVELVFFLGARAARAHVVTAAATDLHARLVDVVITPTPADPLCARAIAVETVGARYRVTTAWVAALPGVVPAARCALPAAAVGAPSLPMRDAARPPTAAVRWGKTWDAPLAELVALGRGNCVAAAVLRFARVPAWTAAGADTVVLEDLRYDRGGGAGFAGFRVPLRPAACPRGVPPWRPPRADLIGA
ncbi:hypothetical protein tb265_16580 [Gemmatimonadetes bacterium T265]|nr:hypothetical protein tb265_16580 [Gemmatimonadetes bacterium T265]